MKIYKTAEHRGTLKEMLKTEKQIDERTFNVLKGFYKFYSYDSRINANRYIIRDPMDCILRMPYWINVYEVDLNESD